ncbi:CopG family ribbon-helix-helix protein [Radicibacter daui]|uniref:CopG family ribbon-helix-helix protein n=1 Tax=Radicibacter daui TaxID=3064829 RepID=UPI00404689DC
MSPPRPTEVLTVHAPKETLDEIDALAAATDQSRDHIVNLALRQYVETNNWQISRIREGLAAANEGRVTSADKVFAGIVTKHGWDR